MGEESAPGIWLAAARGAAERCISTGDAPFAGLLRSWLSHGAPARRARLKVRTGDASTDGLLDALAPGLVALLERLTDRQREVARLLLVEGRRRAQIAESLAISRPTVSVMVERAHLAELTPMADALDVLFGAGVRAASPPGSAEDQAAPGKPA